MSVAFVSDFGPMPAVETDDYTDALATLGTASGRPRAVIVMSGHWPAHRALALTAAERPEIIYDFYGFPEHFYRVKYPCPGAPDVAARAAELLSENGLQAELDPTRGLDHGAWVPLSRVFPAADVPVVQLTVPVGEPRKLLATGQALRPLLDDGVALIGAGALIHNLRRLRFDDKFGAPDPWAAEFDAWLMARLDAWDIESLTSYETLAPSARTAAPTTEHFDPLFYVLGAATSKLETRFHAVRHGSGLMLILA